MQSNRISKWKALFIGLPLNLFLWGGWWYVTVNIYYEYKKIINYSGLVTINVFGLWMPVGFLGLGFVCLVAAIIAISTGLKAKALWGVKGDKIAGRVMLFFGVLGVIIGMLSYSWMTARLSDSGYLYCKSLTRYSATGRHEVYVASPELCVKPSKIK